MLKGKNTGSDSARRMIDFARGLDVNVNLIPWNPIETLPFEEPSREECEAFVRELEAAGLNVTLRRRRGAGIKGACGQLGSAKFSKE